MNVRAWPPLWLRGRGPPYTGPSGRPGLVTIGWVPEARFLQATLVPGFDDQNGAAGLVDHPIGNRAEQ